MRQVNVWVIGVALAFMGGCDDGGEKDGGGGAPPSERTWQVIQEDLPGALLSIWADSADDVWVVGGDPGTGPTAMHFKDGVWKTVDTGLSGNLWWVFSPAPDTVYWSGEGGLLARYTPSTSTVTPIDTGTTATLYGLWGPPEGPLYAVGGNPLDPDEPAVVLRVEGDTATLLDAPATSVPDETWFKVWGTGPEDVWVIGDRGSMAHYDGSWTVERLDGNPRLITLHGASAADRVVVGGAGRFVLLESDGGQWLPAEISGLPALNGVFVAPDGQAAVAGNQGAVAERRDGEWTRLDTPPVRVDWHATWVAPDGAIWVVGGDLFSEAFNRGAILRFGAAE
jgi:hypothetical protein